MKTISNKRILYTKAPSTVPVVDEHLKIDETTIDLEAELPEGDILLKTLEISIDSYMNDRMHDSSVDSYIPPFELNEPIVGDTMCVVIKSNNPDYKVGDIVYARTMYGIFQEYVQVNAENAKIGYTVRNEPKENGLPLSYYISALGMPGFTGYYGLVEVGKPKKGETLYVSAASGAVGQLVGQFGKALGLYVVGSAGSDEKVKYLKNIGFDDAFNYKKGDLEENLRKCCPNGIDIYFESVGGKMLDAVLLVANDFARIVGCGMISQYSLAKPDPLYNLLNIITKRIKFEGYFITDHLDYEDKFMEEVTPLLISGAIKYKEDIIEGFENTPEALIRVYKGENFGKQIVHVSDL